MTSAHQPHAPVVVTGFESARKQSVLDKRGAKRTGSIAPVKNSGRSFKATGWLTLGTARVNDANQSTRIVRKISHVQSLSASASHEQQSLMGKIGNVRKAVGEIRNV